MYPREVRQQEVKNIKFWDRARETYGLPRWHSGKESTYQCRRHGFHPWVGKVPWRRKWQPTQYSCLGNPMDTRAWWVTVHAVTKESDATEHVAQDRTIVYLV